MGNSEFNKLMERFYGAGLMKKVYETDNALVCNVFNQFYIAFSSEILKMYEDRNVFPGFVMNSEGLKQIVQDDSYATTYYGYLPPEQQSRALRFADEKMYETLLSKKDILSKKAPGPNVDLTYEQQLIAEQERKKELAAMMETSTNANTIVLQNASQK